MVSEELNRASTRRKPHAMTLPMVKALDVVYGSRTGSWTGLFRVAVTASVINQWLVCRVALRGTCHGHGSVGQRALAVVNW